MYRNSLAAHVCGRALLLSDSGVLSLQAMLTDPPESPGFLSGVLRALTGERRSHADPRALGLLEGDDAAPAAFWRGAPYLAREAIEPGTGDYQIAEGVALIDVAGVLLDRVGFCWERPELCAYDEIELAIAAAAADDRVGAILMRIDSPGGMTDGLFACAQTIFEASARSGGKPIHAFVPATACSAAYVLAAACDQIIAARGAIVASLGAIMVHVEHSVAARASGYTITAIRSRDHKQAANPFEPLSAEAAAELQSIIDALDARLVEDLGRYRPGLSVSTIDDLAGRIYLANDAAAIAQGLIDGFAREGEAFANLAALAAGQTTAGAGLALVDNPIRAAAIAAPKPAGENPGSISIEEKKLMNREQMIAALGLSDAEAKALSTAELIAKLRETLDAAEAAEGDDAEGDDAEGDDAEGDDAEGDDAEGDDAEAAEGDDAENDNAADAGEEKAKGKGKAAALTGERRVLAILDLPEAQGREGLAKTLARAGLSVSAAKASLAASPKAAPGFPGLVPDPNLSADGGDAGAGQSEAAKIAARALAAAGLS